MTTCVDRPLRPYAGGKRHTVLWCVNIRTPQVDLSTVCRSLASPQARSYVAVMIETGLRGEDLIERAVADLGNGVVTAEALLASVA